VTRTPRETLLISPRVQSLDVSGYAIPHSRPFLCDVRVHPEQVGNVIAHVSNIEYVRWLDRAAELHSDAAGYTREWLLRNDLMWFVARHEIDYLAEVFPDDELVIATWVRDFGRVKSWRDYAIIRPADETVVCRAATLWVLVTLSTRRPKRIEPDLAMRFDPLEAPPSSTRGMSAD
jgi:acyl-CoA thioester hydrolase